MAKWVSRHPTLPEKIKGMPRKLPTQEDIKKLHEIVQIVTNDKDPNLIQHKRKAAAARHFKLDNKTLNKWLLMHPVPPKRAKRRGVVPKIVKDFESTKGWKICQNHMYARDMRLTLYTGWLYTGKQDPYTWDKNVYNMLRRERIIDGIENRLIDPTTGDIREGQATQLRRAINAFLAVSEEGTYSAADKLQMLKNVTGREHGARRHAYLEDYEIKLIIPEIKELDTLIYCMINLESGARPIALCGRFLKGGTKAAIPISMQFTPSQIDPKTNYITRFETKKHTKAVARYQQATIDLLYRYIRDMGIDSGQAVLPYQQDTYSDRLSRAAKRARVKVLAEAGKKIDHRLKLVEEKGFGAYVWRHTFATQALRCGVSIETIKQQGGWKTTDIIIDHYAGEDEHKYDHELQDKPIPKRMKWSKWIGQLSPLWHAQYNAIIQGKLKTSKPKTKRKTKNTGINWNRIKGLAKSPNTPPHFKKHAKFLLKTKKNHPRYSDERIVEEWEKVKKK